MASNTSEHHKCFYCNMPAEKAIHSGIRLAAGHINDGSTRACTGCFKLTIAGFCNRCAEHDSNCICDPLETTKSIQAANPMTPVQSPPSSPPSGPSTTKHYGVFHMENIATESGMASSTDIGSGTQSANYHSQGDPAHQRRDHEHIRGYGRASRQALPTTPTPQEKRRGKEDFKDARRTI